MICLSSLRSLRLCFNKHQKLQIESTTDGFLHVQTSPGDLDSCGYHGDDTLCLLPLDLIGGSWKSDSCLSTHFTADVETLPCEF